MIVLKPPVFRYSGGPINRALYSKTLNLAAARVKDNRDIGKYRKVLEKGKDILRLERFSSIAPDPDESLTARGRKCLLLRPEIKPNVPESWSPAIQDGVKKEELSIVPYEVTLNYDYWDYYDIMESILPEELHHDIPSGFNTAGHVAHLNLKDYHLPYKNIIGEVLIEKNPNIRTVINKTQNVGTESEFRTFNYEVLAGPDDLNVEVREGGCVFRFDYSKVYWNSKLESEHRRLIDLFEPGQVVCDVMAGIGPFALPAAKKEVFVWANDMNPESFLCLKDGIERNKVTEFVRPFNEDGRTFISKAADLVLEAYRNGDCAVIEVKHKSRINPPKPSPAPRRIQIPPTIAHFVMNLPASAYTFVHHYRGLYAGQESLFTPHTATKLPLVHVHCFAVKADDETPLLDICDRLSKELGIPMKPGEVENAGEVAIHNVRDVAPKKSMFCASFRLPPEIAFAPRN